MNTLRTKNLHVRVATSNGSKPVLKGADLTIDFDQIHTTMDPNRSGKSTLAYSITGHPDYEVTDGEAPLDGVDLLEMSVDERARAGLFLTMQYPVKVPGATVTNLLRTAKTAIGGQAPKMRQRVGEVNQTMKNLWMDPTSSQRDTNASLSGGEKKRFEILRMELLRPRFAVLDGIDSGLDADALRIVSEGVNRLHDETDVDSLLITRYTHILRYIKPGRVYVFVDGRAAEAGDPNLADCLEGEDYDRCLA